MIGMMNSGAETSVEFYAAARQSSLYDNRKLSRDFRTYTPEGRVLINGEPLSPHGAEEMWSKLIIKSAAQKIIKNESGTLAKIRRLSEKLKFRKSTTNPKSAAISDDFATIVTKAAQNQRAEQAAIYNSVGKSDEEEPQDTRYVTTIRIESMDLDEQITDPIPPALLEEDSVLARLYVESERLEREQRGHDSGKGSLETVSHDSDVIVEKF
ncbi:unnamed protein product [Caenorhabditis bovis]|uniref:Uncharacterized protein n=1 Tax=Caenorhabditis bovis TaxID=2654633 RepID=A0A8S1EWD1_9PELO|nr:unnamed protein product [Caenorhabditis bovis]